jgi:hypothetical protein
MTDEAAPKIEKKNPAVLIWKPVFGENRWIRWVPSHFLNLGWTPVTAL